MPPGVQAVWNWLAYTVDWGNAQELITWIVAGAALYFAAQAAKAASRTNELQTEQIEQLRLDQISRDEERRREQAEKIAVWCDYKQLASDRRMAKVFGPSRVIQIRNSSELPVYVPTLYVHSPVDDVIEVTEPDIPVPPAAEPRSLYIRQLSEIPQENRSAPLSVGILFRDARNQFWHRGLDGTLRELTIERFFAEVEDLRERYRGAIQRPNQFDA